MANNIFNISIIGKANPINAKKVKFCGEIYLDATEANKPIITM